MHIKKQSASSDYNCQTFRNSKFTPAFTKGTTDEFKGFCLFPVQRSTDTNCSRRRNSPLSGGSIHFFPAHHSLNCFAGKKQQEVFHSIQNAALPGQRQQKFRQARNCSNWIKNCQPKAPLCNKGPARQTSGARQTLRELL